MRGTCQAPRRCGRGPEETNRISIVSPPPTLGRKNPDRRPASRLHPSSKSAPGPGPPLDLMADHLPDYQPLLGAYHAAYADELRAMIADLPIRPGAIVADIACGDGSYSRWLSERSARVVAVDVSM